MKRILMLCMAILLAMSFTACSQETATDAQPAVTQTDKAEAPQKSIEIAAHEELLFCEETVQLAAAVKISDGGTAEDSVQWSSSDTAIATVDANGCVTGVSSGTVTVTAVLADDASVSAQTELQVVAHVSSVSLEQSELVLLTGSAQADAALAVKILPEDAYVQDVVLTSSDEAVVTVGEDGIIHAVAAGTAEITVRSADEACTEEAICAVTVKQGVASVTLSATESVIYLGEKKQLTAEILPEDAEDKTVVWSSSDETVATVDENGNVTAIAAGQAVISCAAQDGSEAVGRCELQVAIAVKKLTVSEKSLVLLVGSTEELAKKQVVAAVEPAEATYQTVSWTSSDETVATVDENGMVIAKAAGKAVITANTTDPRNVGKIKATVNVTVGDAVQQIRLDGAERLAKGTSDRLQVTFTPQKVYNAKLQWKSSNEDIVTVDANGTVRAVGTGTATVTCTATDGSGVSAEKNYTVYQPVTGVKVNGKTSRTIFVGQEVVLGVDVSPADATDKGLEWTSDKPSVAAVDANGKITGKGAGTAIITATAKDGSGKTCRFSILVEPALPITIESMGFGIYNANLLALEFKNLCARTAIKNVDFDLAMYDYSGNSVGSGSYSLGDDVSIGAGAAKTIKRNHTGVGWATKFVITITGVKLGDGSFYSIPYGLQETWTFRR